MAYRLPDDEKDDAIADLGSAGQAVCDSMNRRTEGGQKRLDGGRIEFPGEMEGGFIERHGGDYSWEGRMKNEKR